MKRCLLAVGLVVALCQTSLQAQQNPIADAVDSQPAPLARNLTGFSSGQNSWRFQSRSELGKAVAALKNAESAADKDKAKAQIRTVLENQYDKALQGYEQYLDELARKIEAMKSQLGKRREAKMELVDLRLRMLVSEAEGLGWPDERPTGFFPGTGPGVGTRFPMPDGPFSTKPSRGATINSSGAGVPGSGSSSAGK